MAVVINKKVLLDNVAFELQQFGGVSAVWGAILTQSFLLIPNKVKLLSGNGATSNFCYVQPPVDVELIVDRVNLNFRRYRDVQCDEEVKVFHSSYFRVAKSRRVKNVVTVHDFVYEKYDKGLRRFIHLLQKKHALRKASVVICVSENTKDDLLTFHPWLDSKIVHVIHNGVGKEFYPFERQREITELPYLLYVGGRNVHKNFTAALKLLMTNTARKCELQLRVVGGGAFTNEELNVIKDLHLEGKVEHLGSIDIKSLNLEYNNAFALLYPSFYEGFGIPLLEAMAAGCPVICSNRSSIPEVVGNAGLLFDPEDIKEAEKHLLQLLVPNYRQLIIERGLKRSSYFSWEKTGIETVKLYKKLLDEG
jgi:mannosyltransferase